MQVCLLKPTTCRRAASARGYMCIPEPHESAHVANVDHVEPAEKYNAENLADARAKYNVVVVDLVCDDEHSKRCQQKQGERPNQLLSLRTRAYSSGVLCWLLINCTE